MAKQGFRLKFMFWLDSTKPDEDSLIEQVEQLKQERLFVKTIRDGIRLIIDLREGNLDVLMELFPWTKDALQPTSITPTEQRLQEQIARLEVLLLTDGKFPNQRVQSRAVDMKPQLEINRASEKTGTKTVAKNFMDSMKGFASGFFD